MSGSAETYPGAVVHPSAKIGADVKVAHGAVVEKDVILETGVQVMSRAVVGEGCRVGSGCVLFPGCVLSGGIPSALHVGEGSVLREHVTVRAGTRDCPTRIGGDCLIMGGVHVGSGCQVGDGVVVGNGSVLLDNVHMGERCVVGGLSYVARDRKVGRLTMVGGMSHVWGHVPPFSTVSGSPAKCFGLNIVGLRRAGVSEEVRMELKRAYRMVGVDGIAPKELYERLERDRNSARETFEYAEFLLLSGLGIIL